MRTLLKLTVLVVVLALGATAAVVVWALREVDERSITAAEYDAVEVGTARVVVEDALGEPTSGLDVRLPSSPAGQRCVLYLQRDASYDDKQVYRLCYVDDVLRSKEAFDLASVAR